MVSLPTRPAVQIARLKADRQTSIASRAFYSASSISSSVSMAVRADWVLVPLAFSMAVEKMARAGPQVTSNMGWTYCSRRKVSRWMNLVREDLDWER